mmetsp:Transcript_31938/g.93891  ORF Transcript_31938/g.93891 Transcript_31938/m.93891 type:complete len:235 (+) Transcript_31938:1740-2444(+)
MNKDCGQEDSPQWQVNTKQVSLGQLNCSHRTTQLVDGEDATGKCIERLASICSLRVHENSSHAVAELDAHTGSEHLGDKDIHIGHLSFTGSSLDFLEGVSLSLLLRLALFALISLLFLLDFPVVARQAASQLYKLELDILLNDWSGNAACCKVGSEESDALRPILVLTEDPWQNCHWNAGRELEYCGLPDEKYAQSKDCRPNDLANEAHNVAKSECACERANRMVDVALLRIKN